MGQITYRELFVAYREERASNALVNIPENFDSMIEELMKSLCQKSQTDGQALKELENAKKLTIQIIQLRRQKIIMRAISSQDPKLTTANVREQEFYEKVIKLCSEQDNWVRNLIESKKIEPRIIEEQPQVNHDTTLRLEILESIPAYAGADGKDYGPYEVGDITDMPQNEAQWMIDKKMAKHQE